MDVMHGGDVIGYRMRYGIPPLDFSANLNPLGMPPKVREAATGAVDDSLPYPDPRCRKLTEAMAERLGVNRDQLVFGNGAADIIYRFAHALRPRAALVTAPTFSEYERALGQSECRIERHFLRREERFDIGPDILTRITPDIDVVFLCQPNNPTSRLAAPELLMDMVERCRRAAAVLFVDECFLDLVDHPEGFSLVPFLDRHPHVFILGSFTKLYGMAGIRLGYGLAGDPGLAGKLTTTGQPWAVSTIAQAAGLAALGEDEFVETSRRILGLAKPPLIAGLIKLGFQVLGSEANYLFFHSPDDTLAETLAEKGILIRDCRNFQGLSPGYYRVAVRLEGDNQRLLEALATVVNGAPWQRRS